MDFMLDALRRRLPLVSSTLTLLLMGCGGESGEDVDAEPPCDCGVPDAAAPDAARPMMPPVATPPSGPMSGYFPIAIDLAPTGIDPADIERIELGGIAAIWPEADGPVMTVTVQGHPSPGPVELTLRTTDGVFSFPGVFIYDPPLYPTIGHIGAVGASISQGVQSGAPSAQGTLGAPPALVARQSGAYMGLPLLVDDLFPVYTPDLVASPPDCETPDVVEWLTAAVPRLVPLITDPETRTTVAGLGRVDPTLSPSNLAVGGSVIADALYGPTWPGSIMMSRLVYAPDGQIFVPPDVAPIDLVVELGADIILALDIYGNDVLLQEPAETPDAEEAVRAELVADIYATVERLAQTGSQVFMGTMPPTSIMPESRLRRALRVREEGPEAGSTYDVEVAETDARTRVANEALYAAAALYLNVHVLPLSETVEGLVDTPLQVGDTWLTLEMFGGLVGLDGLHFTDTGNALAANVIIGSINQVMGIDIPEVDLAAVIATDPESTAALRTAGIPIESCLR